MSSLAFAADNGTRTVYTGGHDPVRITRSEAKVEKAPYALTGSEKTSAQVRFEAIRVGSRIVGFQPVGK